MESMLYTRFVMSNKPNDPEECINPKKVSLWTDTKVNYWLFIGIVVGAANLILFHRLCPPFEGILRDNFLTWPVAIRTIIELIPLLAGLLWARSMARFIRGMDELHRRTVIEAWLFSALTTLGILSLWPLLDEAGVSAAIYQATHIPVESLDKPSIWLTLFMLNAFYILGYFILIRRYK
jgi:hypothetical protein